MVLQLSSQPLIRNSIFRSPKIKKFHYLEKIILETICFKKGTLFQFLLIFSSSFVSNVILLGRCLGNIMNVGKASKTFF